MISKCKIVNNLFSAHGKLVGDSECQIFSRTQKGACEIQSTLSVIDLNNV